MTETTKFIITACNAHDDLLEALKEASRELHFLYGGSLAAEKIALRCDAAIAKAQGKRVTVEATWRLFGQDNCKEATQEQLQEGRKVADIVAAAPDMLAALEAVVKELTDSTGETFEPCDEEIVKLAKAAIAKAEGGAE